MTTERFAWQRLPPGFLALSPMAGVTDSPFRQVCKQMGADVLFTEMVSAEAFLHNHNRTTREMLHFDESQRPIICQLMGSDPMRLAEAARRIEGWGFDGVDLNMGCPAQKVYGNRCGSSLLDYPDEAAEIVAAMVAATGLPVSVKMRSGVTGSVQPAFAERMAEAGAQAITIHPRTKDQAYRGRADWEITREIADASPVPVMGSGDLSSWADVERLFATTSVRGAFIARGAMGNPWIFRRADCAPTLEELTAVVREQAQLALELKGRHGLIELRKHLGWYLRGFDGAREIRRLATSVETMLDVEKLLGIVAATGSVPPRQPIAA
ncbi:MAG: tRNA dihydrouridine synthase [Chloroflexia bacterium]